MADIAIVGLGILPGGHLTREAEEALRRCKEILYLDAGIATQAWLETLCPTATSLFGTTYSEGRPRLPGYHDMAARVLDAAMDHPPVGFAINGHPTVGVTAASLVARGAAQFDLDVAVLPGISAMDCLFAHLMLDPVVEGLQMFEATDLLLRRRPVHNDVPVLIWQVGTVESRLYTASPSRPERFSRFRAHLLTFYPADHPVTAVHASSHPLVPTTSWRFPLGGIEAEAERLHAGITLYLPALARRPISDTDLLADLDRPAHLRRVTR